MPANATMPSWTARASAPAGAEISIPFDAVPRPNRRVTLPVTGHSRSPRKGHRFGGRRAGDEIAQRGLELLLRDLELAGELRVQVAFPIDVADEIGAGLRRALHGRLRLFGGRAQLGELGPPLFKRPARAPELLERA